MQILILLNTHIQLRFLPFYFYFKVCSQDRIRTCIVENLQNQYLCHLLALPIAPPDLLLMLKDTEKVFSIQKRRKIYFLRLFLYIRICFIFCFTSTHYWICWIHYYRFWCHPNIFLHQSIDRMRPSAFRRRSSSLPGIWKEVPDL